MKKILISIVCALMVSYTYGQSYLSNVDFTDTIPINNNEKLAGFSSLDSQLAGKEIFLAGENHTYLESNSKLWVQTIRYLHENAGVRNVLMENGRSLAWLIDSYVQSGDADLFKVIEKYAFEEYAEGYKALMEFNQTLDSSEKIRVIGIDLERGTYGAMKVLSMLLPQDKVAPDSIDLHIESIEGMAMYQDRELFNEDEEEDYSDYYGFKYSAKNTLVRVFENFENHEDLYRDYLGDNFPLFKDILNGLEEAKYWNGLGKSKAVQDYIFREKYMYQRFLEEYGKHEGGYYGQFGRCHVTKKRADKNSCQWYVFKSLANRIKESAGGNLKNKVMTFGIMYRSDDVSRDDWDDVDDHISDLFMHLDNKRLMLYDLNKDSILQKFFVEDFDHLFLNSYRPDEEHPYYTPGSDDGYESTGQVIKLVYSLGMQEIDLGSIGALHSMANQVHFEDPLILNGVTFSISDEDFQSMTTGTYIGRFTPIETVESDSFGTVSTRLGGWVYNSTVTLDLLPQVKFLDVFLGGAIGYTELNFKISRDNTSEDLPVSSGFLGERNRSVYKNPGVTASLVFGMDINLGRVTLGGDVGSCYDLSKKEWRLDGTRLETGPKTSLGGVFAHLHAGFNIRT